MRASVLLIATAADPRVATCSYVVRGAALAALHLEWVGEEALGFRLSVTLVCHGIALSGQNSHGRSARGTADGLGLRRAGRRGL